MSEIVLLNSEIKLRQMACEFLSNDWDACKNLAKGKYKIKGANAKDPASRANAIFKVEALRTNVLVRLAKDSLTNRMAQQGSVDVFQESRPAEAPAVESLMEAMQRLKEAENAVASERLFVLLGNRGARAEEIAGVLEQIPADQLVSVLEKTNSDGKTPLHLAVQCGGAGGEFLEAVIEKLEKEQLAKLLAVKDDNENILLHWMARSEGGTAFLTAVAKKLDAKQVKGVLKAKDSDGNMFFHWIARSKYGAAFLWVAAEKLDANQLVIFIEAQDKNNQTFLQGIAQSAGKMKFLKVAAWKLKEEQLMNYLKLAMSSGDGAAFLLVLDGALSKKGLVDFLKTPDPSSGQTVLHEAARSGDRAFLNSLFIIFRRYPGKVIDLLEAKVDGKTPIDVADLIVKQDLEKILAEAKRRGNAKPKSVNPADVLKEIGAIDNFKACTFEQQAYIRAYAEQMIKGGYKAEYAIDVCTAMALLYREKIDELMPDEINVSNTYDIDREPGKSDQEMRVKVIGKLGKIMADNGTNYKIISSFLSNQQVGARSRESCAIKFYLLTQKRDEAAMKEKYYLGIGRHHGQPNTVKKLERKLNKVCVLKEISLDTYAKAVTMYQAFTGVALKKIQVAGSNAENNTCTVYRGMDREALEGTCPNYDKIEEGGEVKGLKHNALESTSVEGPGLAFNLPGTDTHRMEVPFSNVFFVFFMSPEMCKHRFGGEQELLCDLTGVTTILQSKN